VCVIVQFVRVRVCVCAGACMCVCVCACVCMFLCARVRQGGWLRLVCRLQALKQVTNVCCANLRPAQKPPFSSRAGALLRQRNHTPQQKRK
jgi:hypothetical protein